MYPYGLESQSLPHVPQSGVSADGRAWPDPEALYGSPAGDQVETSDARWFTPGDIAALPVGPAMRLRIGHALAPGRPCHIG